MSPFNQRLMRRHDPEPPTRCLSTAADWGIRSCVQGETAMPAKLAVAAVLAFAALPGSAAAAEPYPDRPISMIVPYAAGGSSDVLARLIGERLARSLGQQI